VFYYIIYYKHIPNNTHTHTHPQPHSHPQAYTHSWMFVVVVAAFGQAQKIDKMQAKKISKNKFK